MQQVQKIAKCCASHIIELKEIGSLYDIREYFQGRNDKSRMNSKSNDARYMELISELRSQLAVLADKIKPKVYEYGFLKE